LSRDSIRYDGLLYSTTTEINTHLRLLVHLRQYDLYLSLAIQSTTHSRCAISHYNPAPGLYI